MTTDFLRKQIQLSVGINKFHQAIIIILDQMAVPKRKYSRPKNLVQMSSSAIMKHLYRKKGSTDIKNGCKTTTARVIFPFWMPRGCRGRTTRKVHEERWRTPTNSQSPNADLKRLRRRDLRVWIRCGGSSHFSRQVRSMQRPEVEKTRRSAVMAAAELEWQRNSEGRKTNEGGEWKRPRSCLFIREYANRRARKSRRPE